MANPIVHVNVSQTQAPIPNNLQKTGALISQGGTVLTSGQYSLLTQYSDLTTLQPTPLEVTSLTYGSGKVTAVTAAAHGIPNNIMFRTTVSGATKSGYNGAFIATSTGGSGFTYQVPSNPGVETPIVPSPIRYTKFGVGELDSMANTFFSQQGSAQGVYVLELGSDGSPVPSEGVATLKEFIDSSPQFFYSYLVPRAWNADPSFLTFLANYESTTAKTYFFVTTLEEHRQLYDGKKDVLALIEAPSYGVWPANALLSSAWSGGLVTAVTTTNHGVEPGQQFSIQGATPIGYNGTFVARSGTNGDTLKYSVPNDPGSPTGANGTMLASKYSAVARPPMEFGHASDFFVTLNYNPGPANRVPQLAFSYLYGVTAFPMLGNSALIRNMDDSYVNYIGTGAEGGMPSNKILFNGLTMDGRPFNYWYSVDYVQINAKLFLANAVINGSNTTINPLYYNQQGINRLQQALVGMMGGAITAGLVLGTTIQLELDIIALGEVLSSGRYNGFAVVNAVPFVPYAIANPSHYRLGIYNGLSITFTPLAGFRSITVDINVTDFVG
jgi:hypothetical protein